MKVEWKSCARIGISAFVLYLCITYWPLFVRLISTMFGAATPLLLGCVIAYTTNILMSFYEKHYFPKTINKNLIKSRRPVCLISAFLTMILVLLFVINLVVPELISCIRLLAGQLPEAINNFAEWLDTQNIVPENIPDWLENIDWQTRISQVVGMLTSGISNVMDTVIGAVSSIFSGIVTGLIALIFAIYLLTGKEKLKSQFQRLMRRYVKESICSKLGYVLSVVNDSFHKYIVGQCTEAVILGTLCTVGMFILRIPYATMVGAVIAFTALIPVAGAYIGAGVGAFMILTVSPIKAIIFLIYIVVLQQIEGNLIYPRVVGTSVGLPAIWVLAAVTIGGGLMGITGMLLCVPLGAAIYKLLKADVNQSVNNEIRSV